MFNFLFSIFFIFNSNLFSKNTVKFASLAPDGSTWTEMLKKLDAEITKEKPEISFKIFPGGISGDEFDVIRKLKLGKLHSAGFTGVGLGQILPAVRVLDLPMLFDSYAEIDYISEKLRLYFEEEFLKKDFVLLGWAEIGWVNLFTTKEYKSLEAMRGMKMWVWDGDPLAKAMFKELNISPNPLAITDVFTSLQTGLIEAVYVSPLAAIAMQWFTKTKYMITLKLTNSNGALLMTKEKFNSFSKSDQAYLKAKFLQFSKDLNAASRADNEKAYDTLKKNNVKFVDISATELKIFENSSLSLWNKMANDLYPRELLSKVLNYRKEFRKNGDKVSTKVKDDDSKVKVKDKDANKTVKKK